MVHFLYDRKIHFLSYKNAPRGCALTQKENVTGVTALGANESQATRCSVMENFISYHIKTLRGDAHSRKKEMSLA
jgi:hypothetical protein